MKTMFSSALLGLLLLTLPAQADDVERKPIRGVLTLPDGKKWEFIDISGVRERQQESRVTSPTDPLGQKVKMSISETIPGELVFKPVDDAQEEMRIALDAKVKQVSLQESETHPKYRSILTVLFRDGSEEEIGIVYCKFHAVEIILLNGVATIRYPVEKLVGGTISIQQ